MGLMVLQPPLLLTLLVAGVLAVLYILMLRQSVAIQITGERFEALRAAAVRRGTAGYFMSPVLLLAAMFLLGFAAAQPLYTLGGTASFPGPYLAAAAAVSLVLSLLLRRN